METAYQWATEMGQPPALPLSLGDVHKRAELVSIIDTFLVSDSQLHTLSHDEKKRRIDQLTEMSRHYIPEIANPDQRINICLRLWSSCLMAAKTIAFIAISDQNTVKMRSLIFNWIDEGCQQDLIWKAGVEAAPILKRLRGEAFSLEGVSKNSAVRIFLS